MKYLNIKLRRDVNRNWTQFLSVFLMALLSVLIFVGLQGAWKGLEVSLNNYISTSNLPDAWVQSTGFTNNDIDQIKKINGVTRVSKKISMQANVCDRSNQEKYITLETFDNSYLKFHLTDGSKISNSTTGIWLNQEYANKNGIRVGDNIVLRSGKQKGTLKVLGLIQSADKIYFTGTLEFIAPNHANYGYGVVSEKTLREIYGYKGNYNLLELYGSTHNLRKKTESILGSRNIAYYDRHTLVDVSEALDRVGQIRNLSYLFSFIFILLAILAMYTTIRRLIEKQTQEIAILKALGFSNKKRGFMHKCG